MTHSQSGSRILLAIESSCDETAAAVVADDQQVLSNVVASQTDVHEIYGGVVPEIASRAHVEHILPVIDQALANAGAALEDLDAVAVVTTPGLVGSLLVGLTAAKTLAGLLNIPLIPVNHIEAHLYACQMNATEDIFPAVGLVASGGHSHLFDCRSPLEFVLLGGTVDDAVGEAFDKIAQILGLGYPGGPAIDRAARSGDPEKFAFPRPMIRDDRLAFSFSGIKTAVLYAVRGRPGSNDVPLELTPTTVADLAASFQRAAVDVLIAKCRQALELKGYPTLCVGGGVAANSLFRAELAELAQRDGYTVHMAPMSLCTDNAAMAGIAWELLAAGRTADLDLDVTPGLIRVPR